MCQNAAGSRRVGVTLWQVDDDATATFMVAMYEGARSGLSWADAYTHARRAFLNGRYGDEYRDPYYWSGFVLYGLR